MVTLGEMDLSDLQPRPVMPGPPSPPTEVTRVNERIHWLDNTVGLVDQVVIHLVDRGEDFSTLRHVSQDGLVTEVRVRCEPDVRHVAASLYPFVGGDPLVGSSLVGVG